MVAHVQISKSLFATLLKYLEGLEGKSRAAEVQRAKKIVEGYDRKHLHGGQEVESGDIGARTGESPVQYVCMQALSTPACTPPLV